MTALQTTLAQMLPDGVTCAEVGEEAQTPPLEPLESVLVEGQPPERRREFALGRACARAALRDLGWAGGAIVRTADRGPAWPADFVGSITHTRGYVAAVAARRSACRWIGVDAERVGEVGAELWDLLFTPPERAWLATRPALARATMATVLFSAKESYFKAVHPSVGRWIDFKEITLEVRVGVWRAQPAAPESRLPVTRGRYGVAGDLVITCLHAPA